MSMFLQLFIQSTVLHKWQENLNSFNLKENKAGERKKTGLIYCIIPLKTHALHLQGMAILTKTRRQCLDKTVASSPSGLPDAGECRTGASHCNLTGFSHSVH